jgi:hypothetical protein
MTLSLAITDNADGSGGIATLAGTSGATVALYATPFTGTFGPLAWSLIASRTGDGSINVDPAPGIGYYLWYAQLTSNPNNVSNIVYQALTSGTQSVHYRCLTAVAAQITALSLAGIPSSQIAVRWLPRTFDGVETLPLIAVVPLGKEGQPGVLTGVDDIEYPVVVAIVDAGQQAFQASLAGRLLWRQSIFRTFRHQRLTGVPEIITTDVDPDFVVSPELFAKNYFVSAIKFMFRSREARGFAA